MLRNSYVAGNRLCLAHAVTPRNPVATGRYTLGAVRNTARRSPQAPQMPAITPDLGLPAGNDRPAQMPA